MKICPKCNGSFEEGIAYCPTDGSRLSSLSKLQEAGHQVSAEAVEHAAQVAREEGVEDLTGQTVAGRYRIRRRLGEGGMGVVYSGVDTRLEKEVAIKVLKEDFAHRTEVVTRFMQEAKSAARIKHENVLDVTDYGQTESGSFYIAMELLVGSDLADVLQTQGTTDAARAVNITIQVTRALGAAHAKGIVHRDLKPENVFLVKADDGREVVKIVDFGIAQMKDLSGSDANPGGRKLTRTGMIFGTPEYMSPEQAAGKAIDHRVDIYAVGVILYEMLAGRVPFVGDTFMGVLTQHMFEPVPAIRALKPDAEVPPDLEAVIAKALAKDPTQRYQSMSELTDDLVRVRDRERPGAAGMTLGGRPASATGKFAAQGSNPPLDVLGNTPMATVTRTVEGPVSDGRRKPVALWAAAAAVVLIGAGVAVRALGTGHDGAGAGGTDSGGTTVASSNGGAGTSGTAGVGTTVSNAAGVGTGGTVAIAADAGTGAAAQQPAGAVDAGAGAPPAVAVVHVHVVSTPGSARVDVEEGAGLDCGATPCVVTCAQTPCDLTLPRGRELHLRATAPRKRGEATLTAERDGQEVSVEMTGTGGAASGNAHAGGNGGAHGRNPHCRPGERMWLDRASMMYVPCE